VSLTYHKEGTMVCHYCGYSATYRGICTKCNGQLKGLGAGTQKIEEEAAVLFPEANIARLDSDTAQNKTYETKVIKEFSQGKINIIIGTQMLAKGIDFENVGLVGILNADNLLYHPDFRATERAYQMLVQVSGRTGRRSEQGKVLIQTYQPEHPIFPQIVRNDYKAFFAQDMTDRHAFHYPPYVRLMRIMVKHEDNDTCNRTAEILVNKLKIQLKSRVLGPDTPSVGKIQNKYIRQILVKIEINASIQQAKEIIRNEIQGVQLQKPYNTASIQFDVDPI
jgi:primosomal protein N' (replication factor Y)